MRVLRKHHCIPAEVLIAFPVTYPSTLVGATKVMKLSCSFLRPYVLQWWINDNAADPANMNVIIEEHAKATQLRFKIKKKHLSDNTLRVKCSVEILDLYWRSSEEEAIIVGHQPASFSLPAFSKPMFSDSCNVSPQHLLFVAIFILLLRA